LQHFANSLACSVQAMASLFIFGTLVIGAASKVVPIATFDGGSKTTWPWQTVNDPVMGGQSTSTFHVDSARSLGVWEGEVRIVPFLKSPGFCNLQAPGLYKTAAFPDLSGTQGMVVRARETNASGITRFNVMLMTSGAKHFLKQGVYTANFVLNGDMEDHFLPFSSFTCTWRGQKVTWCPSLSTELGKVTNVGVGTAFPGPAAKFHVEISSLSASAQVSSLATNSSADSIDLATFDGKTAHKWKTENDPVMGGQSDSKFEVKDGYGEYSGTCRIVPSLKAPGFTIALTETPLLARFPDASSANGIVLAVRNVEANVTQFKFAFCDSRINFYRCQFQSFKADFKIAPSDTFTEVFLPWSAFSDKWSASTGQHTAESPPQAESLRSITQLQLWTEGVAGKFRLQLKYVRASKAPLTLMI